MRPPALNKLIDAINRVISDTITDDEDDPLNTAGCALAMCLADVLEHLPVSCRLAAIAMIAMDNQATCNFAEALRDENH